MKRDQNGRQPKSFTLNLHRHILWCQFGGLICMGQANIGAASYNRRGEGRHVQSALHSEKSQKKRSARGSGHKQSLRHRRRSDRGGSYKKSICVPDANVREPASTESVRPVIVFDRTEPRYSIPWQAWQVAKTVRRAFL